MPTPTAPSPRDHRMYHVTNVANPDIATFAEMADQRLVEILKSASGALDDYTAPDKKRLGDFVNELRAFKAWFMQRPEPDRPNQHPEQLGIDYQSNKESFEDPVTQEEVILVQKPENMASRAAAQQMREVIASTVLGASRFRPGGMNAHDSRRVDDELDRLEFLLTEYIMELLPVDLPETNPSAPLTGHGSA
jgi:hypothetical protein